MTTRRISRQTRKLCLLLEVWLSVDLWVEMAPLERSRNSWSCERYARWHKSMCRAFRAREHGLCRHWVQLSLIEATLFVWPHGVISVPHVQTKVRRAKGAVRPCTPLAHGATKGLTKRPSVKRSISTWRHCVTALGRLITDYGASRPSSII